MVTVLGIIWAITTILLVLVAGVRPRVSKLSQFELERRANQGQVAAKESLRQMELLPDILALQRVVAAFLLVCSVLLCIGAFGWVVGAMVAIVVALEYTIIANLSPIRKFAGRYYQKWEAGILGFVERIAPILQVARAVGQEERAYAVHSKEELVHLVSEASGDVLQKDEKSLIVTSLEFENRLVSEVMTPRSVIDSIDSKEHLGPLVLSDLHKTGHSRFPVTEGDIDHIIGILHVRDLLTIDAKRKSTSVAKAMDPRVCYIREDQTLSHALSAFLKTRYHMFVVVNQYRETVGVLCLEDVIEALIGRKIIDEFDAHDSLRVVAERNPRGNNTPKSHTNV